MASHAVYLFFYVFGVTITSVGKGHWMRENKVCKLKISKRDRLGQLFQWLRGYGLDGSKRVADNRILRDRGTVLRAANVDSMLPDFATR